MPDGVSDEDAASCEPLAVAAHAVRGLAVRMGDSVAMLGEGLVGLFNAVVDPKSDQRLCIT